MKLSKSKGAAIVCSLVLSVFSLSSPLMSATAAAANLVANPSMEQANTAGTAPLNWQTDRWGTNTTTFQYKTNGYNSSRSVYVNITQYTSGDAKWFFDPVTVTGGTVYTFSDTYQSSVATRLVAMSLDASNKASYFDVNTNVPASNGTWKTISYNVTAPASAKKMTILHLIKKVGWLQTDNFSFTGPDVAPDPAPTPTPTPTPTPSPTPNSNVPNYSVEQVSATNTSLPASWEHSSWGTNSPTYQYIKNDGHDGTSSVKVTMGSYTDGDAKWVYTPQSLTKGADYRFTGWYKTNTIPHVVVQYIKADGSEDFFGMPDPQPAADAATTWQRYSDVFSVPQDAQAVSVFFFLSNSGWVQTDDYNVSPYTYPAFNRGLVSITFDDGFEENMTTALPVLKQYGFKTTHCFATQYVEGDATAISNVQKIAADGHEICSHTVTHPWLTSLTTASVDYELQHSQQFLQSISGQPVTSFTSPYGDYNAAVNTEIKKFYKAHRTTDEGFNSKDNLNAYRLRVQNMKPTTTLAEFQAWVNKAKADHTWLIVIYHQITTDPANLGSEEYNTAKADFDAQMAWLAGSGVTVARMDQALAETSAQ